MRSIFMALTGLVLASGCATTPPFRPVETAPLGDIRAETLRRTLADSMPERFTLLGSVVFAFRGRSLAAISVTEIDEPARFFSVAAVTPVGLKLFEVSGKDGMVETADLAPGLDRRGNPANAIAKDVQRVYFDRVPAPGAAHRRKGERVLFVMPMAEGKLEHVVGGAPPVLLEKRLKSWRGTVWSVTYHDYEERNGKLHPGGVVFRHHRYRYRLILRMKDVLEDTTVERENP